MYSIRLSNGIVLENLGLNGTNYISPVEIDESVFNGGLDEVEITDTDTGNVTMLHNAELVVYQWYGEEFWIAFIEKSQSEMDTELMLELAADHEERICLLELFGGEA